MEISSQYDGVTAALSIALFLLGLGGLLTQRSVIKQVVCLKVMLQGVTLALILAGRLHGDLYFAQGMVVSALIVESVVIALALALIVNIFQHYASGDVDDLNRLRG